MAACPGSDWDLLVVVPDDAPDTHTDPVLDWDIARRSDVSVTLLVTWQPDLAAIWGLPDTIGWSIAHDGIALRVDRCLIAHDWPKQHLQPA